MPPGDAESKTAFLKDCYIRLAALQQAPARSRASPPTTISCAGALEPNPAEQNVPEAVECRGERSQQNTTGSHQHQPLPPPPPPPIRPATSSSAPTTVTPRRTRFGIAANTDRCITTPEERIVKVKPDEEPSRKRATDWVDRRRESTTADSMAATLRSTSTPEHPLNTILVNSRAPDQHLALRQPQNTCSHHPAQHIPPPPPPIRPHKSATKSDPNESSNQTRTTSDQRNIARQSRGAMEPRRDGGSSWREPDRYNPPEKTERKRTISEPAAPSSDNQRSDESHEAAEERGKDTGEPDQDRVQRRCLAQHKRRSDTAAEEHSSQSIPTSVDHHKESTSAARKGATPRSTSTYPHPHDQHITMPPCPAFPKIPNRIPWNAATKSDPNEFNDQRNNARRSLGAMEPRRDGGSSGREPDRYNPPEKTVRKRTIGELAAPSSNKRRSDESHEATEERGKDNGEQDQDRVHPPCFEASFNFIMTGRSTLFEMARWAINKRHYRDWDEEYYSQEEFEAHYGEEGHMCYEEAKYATTETVSALMQMQQDQRMFASLKSVLESWLKEKPEREQAKLIFEVFYVTLRCRAQYLWTHYPTLAPSAWTRKNLSSEQAEIWNHVKAFVGEFARPSRGNKSQIPYLIHTCAGKAKITYLIKIVLTNGVYDSNWSSAITKGGQRLNRIAAS